LWDLGGLKGNPQARNFDRLWLFFYTFYTFITIACRNSDFKQPKNVSFFSFSKVIDRKSISGAQATAKMFAKLEKNLRKFLNSDKKGA
jgi:hypothetical protein